MTNPLISIIIPIYNGAQTIDRCITSLKKQTLKACEFIFVDDGSTDNTAEKLIESTKGDARFVILKMGRRTDPFHARKKGISAATGQYIMFLDADDTFIAKGCEIAYKTISSKKVDIVLFGYRKVVCTVIQKIQNATH
jgi:glycosyltransferase involved in cell wall biosynthesis